MPLKSGSSKKVISENIRMMMGEMGKSPHIQSRKQVIAIAMEMARKRKKKGKK